MNAASRAILQTVLATDPSLITVKRRVAQRLLDGQTRALPALVGGKDGRLLVAQKEAAEILNVSRAKVWRMTKDCALHPEEILPGTWRYHYREIATLALQGAGMDASATAGRPEMSAA